ncbi:MAG: hypothetical protein Q8P99_02800 [bacterium]|nr:hypothetical protein [bacterium]MDZ4231416.1 hypothetical protein [Patescibacteria group bacterium]
MTKHVDVKKGTFKAQLFGDDPRIKSLELSQRRKISASDEVIGTGPRKMGLPPINSIIRLVYDEQSQLCWDFEFGQPAMEPCYEGRIIAVDFENGEILVRTSDAFPRQAWFRLDRHSQLDYDAGFEHVIWGLTPLRDQLPIPGDPVLVAFDPNGYPVCWAWRGRRSTRVLARASKGRLARWAERTLGTHP